MPRPYSILYIIPSLQVGGTEKSLVTLLRHLDRGLFKPELACTLRTGPLLDEVRTLGIPLHLFSARHALELPTLRGVTSLMRRRRYDLVHTMLIEADLFGRFGALLAGRPPCISTLANSYPWQDSRTPRERAKNAVARWSTRRLTTCVISKSAALAKQYQESYGYTLPRLTIIPNGIPWDTPEWRQVRPRAETRTHLGIAPDTVVALIVASLTEKKDHRTLLTAWATVVRESPGPTLLLIAGEGPLHDELHQLAAGLGIAGCVRFLGRRDDVPALWAAADIGVLSSVREGMPNAMLEAGAMGCPVVATDVGGVTEVVREGETGLIVPSRNPAALGAAILRLVKDADMRRRLGSAARELIRAQFDAAAVARRHEELYLSLLEPAP